MKTKVLFIFSVLFIVPSILLAGTAYYVDCSSSSNGNGSFKNPWNNIQSINDFNFSKSDDVYFKVDTKCSGSKVDNFLNIDWSGTSGDWVVVGAYYGNGQFGLNGGPRPIIDGGDDYPTSEKGIVDKTNSSPSNNYIEIKDIRINNSLEHGVSLKKVNHFKIDNVYTYKTRKRGIAAVQSSDGEITDSTVELASYNSIIGQERNIGAAILVSAQEKLGNSDNVLVARNTVFHSSEGIGIYQMVRYAIIENNVCYDNRKVHLYIDESKYITVRDNLLYSSNEVSSWCSSYGASCGPVNGIWVQNEATRDNCFIGDNEFYGNMMAGVYSGFQISSEYGKTKKCGQTNNHIYNNTIVDPSNYSFRFYDNDNDWSGNVIEKNVSWTISGDGKHAHDYSPAGITWDKNNFDDSVSGKASNDALIHNPKLSKTSGWRGIEPGSAKVEWFLTKNITNIDYNIGLYSLDSVQPVQQPSNQSLNISPPSGLKILIQ